MNHNEMVAEIDMHEDAIEKALNIAWNFGQTDGAHHKMWVIDQMVRALCCTAEGYHRWVEIYEAPVGDDEDDYYEWDIGIAP